MEINRKPLLDYLDTAEDPALIKELGVPNILESFFAIAEAGRFELCRKAELDNQAVALAIGLALGREVLDITLVSIKEVDSWVKQNIPEQPPWLQDKDMTWLRDQMEKVLNCAAGSCFHGAVWRTFTQEIDISLFEAYNQTLGPALLTAARACFEQTQIKAVHFNQQVEEALCRYLTRAVAGDRQKVTEMSPLMKMLPRAIPLTETSMNSNKWRVLVA